MRKTVHVRPRTGVAMGPEVEEGGYVCYSKSESEKSREIQEVNSGD